MNEEEKPVYEYWTKKLDSRHLYRRGDYKTLCGKSMLGNNYTHDIKERGYCEECEKVWQEETGKPEQEPYLERNIKFSILNVYCRYNDGAMGCNRDDELHTCCSEECKLIEMIFQE